MAQLWASERPERTCVVESSTVTGVADVLTDGLPMAASPQHFVSCASVMAQKLPALAVPGIPTAPLIDCMLLKEVTGSA